MFPNHVENALIISSVIALLFQLHINCHLNFQFYATTFIVYSFNYGFSAALAMKSHQYLRSSLYMAFMRFPS